MSKGQRTSVSNTKLNHLLKLADTYCINVENGVWDVPQGTYQAILKSVNHVKTEMFKQSRQRRKTMNIEYVADEERRAIVSQQNLREEEG
tara:strand:+ start:236 stop:505 length:270 start_codon:yes stop_codon:yes gene_type:complete